MDEIWNCILSICCDPIAAPEKREKAMARLLEQRGGLPKDEAAEYAPVVLRAIAPLLETLNPFIVFVSKAARGPNFKE